MSILELRKIGSSVDTVMKNNFQSIETSKAMLDAVERENNGILLWMQGDSTKGNQTLDQYHQVMLKALLDARLNISEKDEDEYIKKIEEVYTNFYTKTQAIIASKNILEKNKRIHADELENAFIQTKSAINSLIVLNQDQMYSQTTIIKENSQRSLMPGIISVIAAVLFAIMLNFFISIYFIKPIQRLIDELKAFYPAKGKVDAKIVSKDEIKTLENEINNLIRRLNQRVNQ